MNISKKTHTLVWGGVIAALYVALTYTQEALLPGTTSMAVQFRLSEALTLLSVFTPAAIPGLTVGCIVTNLISAGVLPLDIILGSFATLLATVCMNKFRNITFKGLPVLSALMPAVFNGVIIGLEIEIFFIEGSFHLMSFVMQCATVALGELVVCLIPGLMMVKIIKNKKLEKYLSGI